MTDSEADAIIAGAEAALGLAVRACRRRGPKEACDMLEALTPIVRALQPKRTVPVPEHEPERHCCPAQPKRKNE
ncbi:hypothetical protein [Anaeromyxobacter oryzae]|nr:hypothetical protein [Anaeromyxobacter oryzae]